MSYHTIQVTDEMLEDCPSIKAVMIQMMWKDYWRNLRIEKKKNFFGENYYQKMIDEGKPIFHTKRRKVKPDYSEEIYEGL